ncbi:pectinesterase [Sarracenia purpurea var. burkii]
MVSNLYLSSFTIFLILLCFSSSLSSPDVDALSNPASAGEICSYTPYPSFCKSVLPNNNSANVYDYGLLSVGKSLSSASKFLSLIDKFLLQPSTLTPGAIAALQDCRFLAALNLDFLSSISRAVNASAKTLPVMEADEVQTLLSAILTNAQTCLDGVQATASSWSVKNGISTSLANDTKLFSVSLALFTKGWVPDNKKKQKKGPTWKGLSKKQLAFSNGRLPLKMSGRNQAIYESVSRRKLLLASNDGVVVSDMVTVSQDGSTNFTTINDAVAAAPNNTNSTAGYFLIYITAGIYQEYVLVPKNKKYLMMIGDGINQTVITGNHSFVDGWTTFNSSTFGEYKCTSFIK